MSRYIKSADGKTKILVAGTDQKPVMSEAEAREKCSKSAAPTVSEKPAKTSPVQEDK